MVFTRPCDSCGGRGQVTQEACRPCGGLGVSGRTEVLALRLPSGIESGARVAVPGRGDAGARGGPAGDLYVTVQVDPHPYFRRVCRDVHVTVPVASHDALLGARIDVPTPTGGRARFKISPGTAAGREFRLTGQGLPGRGDEAASDLVVTIEVHVPSDLDERSRELAREFGRRNDQDVRRHLFE